MHPKNTPNRVCEQCGKAERVAPSRAARRFCSAMCYRDWLAERRGLTPMNIARFWSMVDTSGGPDTCWEWQGGRYNYGYGQCYWFQPFARAAHRAAWQIKHGNIPDGLHVCHSCDNPPCCNPLHLFLGTISDNMRDKEAKGRGFHGTAWNPKGETNPRAKLAETDIIDIRKRWSREHLTNVQIAREYGVSDQLVSMIIRHKCWTHLPSVDDLSGSVE